MSIPSPGPGRTVVAQAAVVVSLSGGALLANLVSVTILVVHMVCSSRR
jgi:hypothetical protein